MTTTTVSILMQKRLDIYKKIADDKTHYNSWTFIIETGFSALALLLLYYGWLNVDALGILGLTTTGGGVALVLAQAAKTAYDKVMALRTDRYNNGVFYSLMTARINNLSLIPAQNSDAEVLEIARALADWCKQLVPENQGGICPEVP